MEAAGGKDCPSIARAALASVAPKSLLRPDAPTIEILSFLRRAPFALAAHYGYRIINVNDLTHRFADGIHQSDSDLLGVLDTGRNAIVVKNARSEQRHITINHEISHIILKHPTVKDGVTYRVRAKSTNPFEREAERLAAELSAPTKILRRVFEDTFGPRLDVANRDDRMVLLLRTRNPDLPLLDVAQRIAAASTLDGTNTFPSLAEQFGVSVELMARRLIETELVFCSKTSPPQRKPRILIFSAAERLPLAEELALKLRYHATMEIWSDKLFDGGEPPAHAIDARTKEMDFAICLFGRDDKVWRNGKEVYMPRHNVAAEAFFCFARLGFAKTAVIAPEAAEDFEIPSNFDGIEPIHYLTSDTESDPEIAMRMVSTMVRKRFKLPQPV